MHVSLSEVEAATAKAAMSVGFGPGLGEDAGRAAKLMLRSGVGAFADLVGALDAADIGASAGLDASEALSGRLSAARPAADVPGETEEGDGFPGGGEDARAPMLSSLAAGPTACDLLASAARGAADAPRAVDLASVDYPVVVLHLVLDASRTIEQAMMVSWTCRGCRERTGVERAEVLVQSGAIHVLHGGGRAFGAGPAQMSIRLASSVDDRRGALVVDDGRGAELEDAVWERLYAYADRQLVEGDERTRLSGAGAGVIDAD